MNEQFELNIVRVAKHQCGAEAHINDSRVRNAFGVEVRNPALQFVPVRDSESKMIEANTPFVKDVT